LVQVENIRIKLAKVAAAVAARVFNTDEKCQNLVIDEIHVKCACQFLRIIYAKPSMAYDVYSKMATTASTIDSSVDVGKVFKNLGDFREPTVTGLLELTSITADHLADYTGDLGTAKSVIGELVRFRCLSRAEGTSSYFRNPAFTQWLRKNSKSHHKGKDLWQNL
jgi:hypothetical protein